MEKSKKIFLLIGFPLLCFMTFITATYYMLGSLWILTIGTIILLTTYHKKRKYITLTKLGIILFLLFLAICWNPIHWPSQINRRLDRGSLIKPNSQSIANLENTFTKSQYYQGPYNRDTIQGQLKELQDIQSFLYNDSNRDWLDYEYDFYQYPGVFDHIPSPEEVLSNRKDDCDGIAVVTVSLLTRRGYEAYIAESDFHWWTYVKVSGDNLNSNIEGKSTTVVYLNWWEEIGEPYVVFNKDSVILKQPVWASWVDLMTDEYPYELMKESGLPLLEHAITWILFLPAMLFLGFLFTWGVRFPRGFKEKRSYLGNSIFVAIVLGILIFLFLFSSDFLLTWGTPILLTSLGALIFLIDRNYVTKWVYDVQD